MKANCWAMCVAVGMAVSSTRAQAPGCVPYLKPRFLSNSPHDQQAAARYAKILPAGASLRFFLPVSADTKLIVYEPPNPKHDELQPDTHLLLLHAGKLSKRISFRAIGIPQQFRVVSAARLCTAENAVIYLASGSGATAGSEAFVALVFGAAGVRTSKLPFANQGRLEIFESAPFTVKLWSAVEEDMGYCGACPKHCDVSTFSLKQEGFKKIESRRKQKMIAPDPLIDRPLLLHRASEPQETAP